jgi:hypothetical protein
MAAFVAALMPKNPHAACKALYGRPWKKATTKKILISVWHRMLGLGPRVV